MRRHFLISTVVLGFLIPCFVPSIARADEKVDVAAPDAIAKGLEKLTGKPVTLRLHGGEEVSGVLDATGPTAVRIAQLTGKEFYSAIIKTDAIEAVIYRAK